MKLTSAFAVAVLFGIAPAQAATAMVGDTPTVSCAKAAMAERPDARISDATRDAALATCNTALADKILQQDRTATLVNRGIILAAAGNATDALDDYIAALARDPSMANTYINRGSALLRIGRYQEARADFDRALSLGTDQQTIAYFCRGMAQEKLGALTAAYNDYKKAQSLSPDFKPANIELARFQVNSRVAQNH